VKAEPKLPYVPYPPKQATTHMEDVISSVSRWDHRQRPLHVKTHDLLNRHELKRRIIWALQLITAFSKIAKRLRMRSSFPPGRQHLVMQNQVFQVLPQPPRLDDLSNHENIHQHQQFHLHHCNAIDPQQRRKAYDLWTVD
jgi:hypothetical protein